MIHLLRSSSSLAKVLILPFVILIVVLSLLVGLLSYFAGRHAVVSVAEQMLDQTADRVALTVQRHIDGATAVLESAFPRGLPAVTDVNLDLDAIRTRFWIATSLHPELNNYVFYGNRSGDFVGLFRYNVDDAELRIKRAAVDYRSAYRFDRIGGQLSMPKNDATQFDPRTGRGTPPARTATATPGARSISTTGIRTWSPRAHVACWPPTASSKA